MPTTRQRYQVTETDALAHALKVAERKWPGEPRSALLAALAEEGARAIEEANQTRREERRELVERLAGGFDYEPGYLEELRKDWPE